jgi:C4-dicarboxylate-specific signal transduction histidine kinase
MDVTAAKNAERQLHRTQSELAHISRVTSLGELTASIAHEVGQPLAAIVTHAEASLRWLGREVPEINEATIALRGIINDGNRASEIVQRIRSLIKKADQERSTLRLNEMIEDVIPLLQREISEHRITLQLDLAAGLPPVLGDRVQLQQVIINLVVNAIQAMTAIDGRPRDLVIRSRQGESGTVLVAIQDSGEGLSEATMSRLFGAFFTTKPNGMGMGLSICRSIIEAHDGRIWATAAEGGPGASFQFSLPAMPTE